MFAFVELRLSFSSDDPTNGDTPIIREDKLEKDLLNLSSLSSSHSRSNKSAGRGGLLSMMLVILSKRGAN